MGEAGRLPAALAVVSATVLVAFGATAQASTVSATSGGSGPYGVAAGGVRFEAAPGEANRVSARLVEGSHGIVEVRDDGAPLTAGARCTGLGNGAVRCDAAADFVTVHVDAGDGDDSVSIDTPLYGIVLGGSGNDTLTGGCQLTGGEGNDSLVGCLNALSALGHNLRGGPGDDSIEGGPGAELINGGGGNDVIRGGDGDDSIDDGDAAAGTVGADAIDGGAGSDTVTYADRKSAVAVDLAQPGVPQGGSGEGDAITGVENLLGSPGQDLLLGDDTANRLDGGDGPDTIDGRGGDDVLLDGAGRDVVSGGAGNDFLVTRDLYRDSVSCGAGKDRLLADRGDDRAAGCEAVDTTLRLVAAKRLGVTNRRISIMLRCNDADELPRTVAREFQTCVFDLALRIRVGGRLRTVATGSCGLRGCRTLVMQRSAWRLLLARRSMPAWIQLQRRPHAFAFHRLEKVTLKLRRVARSTTTPG